MYIYPQPFTQALRAMLPVQVFYHLGELDDALNYALGAGSLFDVEEQSEYVTTLIGKRWKLLRRCAQWPGIRPLFL